MRKLRKNEANVEDFNMNIKDARRVHDLLLVQKPEDAEHARETCAFCLMPNEGGSVAGRTYTEDEFNDAVNPLLAKMAELQDQVRVSAVEDQVEAAKAEVAAEIESLQSKLDTAVLEKQAAVDALDAFKADADAKEAKDKEDKEKEGRKADREKEVKEKAAFPDEYITDNLDRWAALPDEDWQEKLSEWAALVPAHTSEIPSRTALSAARETGATKPTNKIDGHKALYREIVGESLDHTLGSFDPRSIK